jgi:ATP-dependent DNA ligase
VSIFSTDSRAARGRSLIAVGIRESGRPVRATGGLSDDHLFGLTYFAFDLLYLDEPDLRRCPIEERKTLLQQVLDEARCDRLVYVDHVIGRGAQLFDRVREVGAEGIVSKRLGSLYRGRESRDWLKTKCHQVEFVITGFEELGEGRLEAIHVAQEIAGKLVSAGPSGSALPARGCGASWTRCVRDRHERAWFRSGRH